MGSDREETQHTELLAALSHVPHFSHPTKTFTSVFSINFSCNAVTST